MKKEEEEKKEKNEEEEERRRMKKYSRLLSICIEGNHDNTNNQHVQKVHSSSPEVPIMFF